MLKEIHSNYFTSTSFTFRNFDFGRCVFLLSVKEVVLQTAKGKASQIVSNSGQRQKKKKKPLDFQAL